VQFWWYVEAPLCFARPVLHQSSDPCASSEEDQRSMINDQ
jgi:hypothetical protein